MRNLGSQVIAGLFNKSLEQPTGGQDNYPEEKIQDLLSAMILRAMDGYDVLKDCPDCGFLADLMAAVVEHAKEGDDSPEVKACVSKKIPILINEGMGQAQAVAVSFAMCRKNPDVAKGKEVPDPVKRKVEGPIRYLSYADLAEFGRERLKSMSRPQVPVLKEGTSEGAKKGWESRRGGSAEDDAHSDITPERVKSTANQMRDSVQIAMREAEDKAGWNAAHGKGSKVDALRVEAEESIRNLEGSDLSTKGGRKAAFDVAQVVHTVVQDLHEQVRRLASERAPVTKAGTSEGAKLGWETRRGGAGEEPTGTMESAKAVTARALEDFDEGIKGAEAVQREVDAERPKIPNDRASQDKFYAKYNPLFREKEEQAGKAVARVMDLIDGLKGTPGIDEKERSEVGFLLMRADYVFGPGDSRLQHEHPDVWEEGFIPRVRTYLTRANDLVASAKGEAKKGLSFDGSSEKSKEIKTMEKEVANLANALFPKWISQGSKVAPPGEVKEIRKEFLTGLYKKRVFQEDVTEDEVPIEKSVVSLSRMPEAVETFAAPPANWQEGYTPIERQNLLAWVEAVDKARQTDVFRRGGMNAPFSPEFESMESRQSIGKWLSDNPDHVAYHIAQNVNLASRPSVRTMKDRVVQIAQEITTMAQQAAK